MSKDKSKRKINIYRTGHGPEDNKSRDERRCCKLDVTEIAPLHLTGSRHGTPMDFTLL